MKATVPTRGLEWRSPGLVVACSGHTRWGWRGPRGLGWLRALSAVAVTRDGSGWLVLGAWASGFGGKGSTVGMSPPCGFGVQLEDLEQTSPSGPHLR